MNLRITTLLALITMITTAVFAAEKPSARCLPTETFAAMRIPAGKKFADHLIKQTKFGAVLFSEDRWQKVQDVFAQESDIDIDEANKKLAAFGLSMDDFKGALNGETGLAFLAEPREDRQPVLIGLAWIEPGEEQAGRLFSAIAQRIDEDAQTDEFPTVRHDIALGDYKAMHMVVPEVDEGEEDIDFDEQWEQMEEGDQADGHAEAGNDEDAGPKPRVVDQTHVLLVHRKTKLLLAFTFPQSREQIISLLDAEKKIDWDQMTGAQQVKGAFARFLEAHDEDDDTVGPFAQRAIDTKGLHEAMPAGVVGMEAMIDMGAGVDVMTQFDDTGEAAPAIKSLGLDQLGFLSVRWSLDGSLMRGGAFIAAPTPRKAMLGLLDQEEIAPQPPAWVPYDVLQYAHFSLDLGGLYTLVKQMVIEIGGQEAANGFQMAEQQSMMMLQADVATILSSLGQQHSIFTYLPMPVKEGADENDITPTQRMAFVWQVKDEQLWQRVMQMIGGFAQMSDGAMVFAEEQGFSGWRLNQPQMQGGLFFGKGYLVVTLGEGVAEATLAALSNPPEGDAALRNSPVFKRAAELMDFEPGIALNISDTQRAARYMKQGFLQSNFKEGFVRGAASSGGVDAMNFITALLELMPSDEEIQGMFGVAAGYTKVDDNGITSRSILELPPPEAQ